MMPWKRIKSGYRTAKGGFVRRPKQYEALRKKGLPKSTAAKIANSPRRKKSK